MKIIIEGECAEGKTTMALLIADVLRKAGFGVHVADVDLEDQHAALFYSQLQDQRVAAMIAKDTLIDIETVQTRKAKR